MASTNEDLARLTNLGEYESSSSIIDSIYVVLISAYLFLLSGYLYLQHIDQDEGFYSTAARLVTQGQFPYLDFFYPQAPILPYIYGIAAIIFGQSLISLRFFSLVCGILTAIVWIPYLNREYSKVPSVAIFSLLLFITNPYLPSWIVLVKTYSFCNLMLSICIVSLYFGIWSNKSVYYFCAGAAMGFAIPSISNGTIRFEMKMDRDNKSRNLMQTS